MYLLPGVHACTKPLRLNKCILELFFSVFDVSVEQQDDLDEFVPA